MHKEKAETLAKLRKGDAEATEEFLGEMGKLVISKIHLMVHDWEIAKELKQEVLLKIVQGIKDFREECELRSWVLAIVRNQTNTYLRKKRISETPIGSDVDFPAPDRRIDRRVEDEEMLIMFLKQLSEEEKQTWWLHHYMGWKGKKIARHMGVEPGTISSRVSRLRKKFEEFCRSYREGLLTRSA